MYFDDLKIGMMVDTAPAVIEKEKMEAFAQHLRHQNVVAMAGVPSWILMIVNRMLTEKAMFLDEETKIHYDFDKIKSLTQTMLAEVVRLF